MGVTAGASAPELLVQGLIDRLSAAGVTRIEAASFVRDDRVPAMAGAEAVLAEARPPLA